MNNTQTRHDELRNRIVDLGEKAIAENGSGSINARTLAKKAECSVGAIYNVFSDLNAIIAAINVRTLERMRQFVLGEFENANTTDPKQLLLIASCAYLKFALENQHLWKTVFEVEIVSKEEFPTGYLEKSDALFSILETLFAQIYVDDDMDEVKCITRTFFSAVHGVVNLGVERRLISMSQENLEGMVTWLVRQILK